MHFSSYRESISSPFRPHSFLHHVFDRIIMLSEDQKTVIVVGGGLSGLTAAREILKRKPKTKVIVLEAAPEVGGRTRSIKIQGCIFDEGGMFIGKSQTHAIELAAESGNQLLRTECKGDKLMEVGGKLSSYRGDIPSLGWLSLLKLQWNIWKIDWMAKKVPILDPNSCPLAHHWDALTIQAWIASNLSSEARLLLEAAIRVILGTELSQVSLLFFLHYINQSSGFQNLTKTEGGLQESFTSLGTQHMSLFLQEQIKSRGGEVKLNFKVKSIIQNEEGCRVQSHEGLILKGDYVVIAAPPSCAKRITFTPQLSTQRRLINDRAFMGTLAKVILLYKERYWKHKGFTGEFVSDCSDSPLMNCFDGSKPNENGEIQPTLIVFVGGAAYRYWKERKDFQSAILSKLASIYNQQALLKPTLVHWRRWEDQTVGGAPVCLLPPGVLSQVSDLRKPEGRVHWAGTEMATVSTGFMDGAIQSGKRAAQEVIDRLQDIQSQQYSDEVRHGGQKPDYLLANTSSARKWLEWW